MCRKYEVSLLLPVLFDQMLPDEWRSTDLKFKLCSGCINSSTFSYLFKNILSQLQTLWFFTFSSSGSSTHLLCLTLNRLVSCSSHFHSTLPGNPRIPLGSLFCLSHFRCSPPVSIPPFRYLSIPPSLRPSVCLAHFLWRIVLVSSSLNKSRLFPPWGKIVLSSPQTCSLGPYLSSPPAHPNCLAWIPPPRKRPLFSSISNVSPPSLSI